MSIAENVKRIRAELPAGVLLVASSKMNGPEAMECRDEDNLVAKAYSLIADKYDIPRMHIHLYKGIPSQAGLGGGSSDAASMIRLLDEYCHLNMGYHPM